MAKAAVKIVKRDSSGISTRATRAGNKLGALRQVKCALAKLPSTITLSRRQVTEVAGFIVSVDEHSLCIRQRLRHGSSKQVVRSYPLTDVVSRTEGVNCFGVIHVITDTPVLILKDQSVTYSGAVIVATDNKTGEVTNIYPSPLISVEILGDEPSDRAAPVKSSKGSNVAKIGNGKKKKRSDSEL